MKRQYVDSSLARSLGYNPVSSILEIEFKPNGYVWQYFDVPEKVYIEMMSSDSIGRYFNENIKGFYPEKQVK